MSLRDTYVTLLAALILTPLVVWWIGTSYAQVMESPNYKIESDSINFGGGLSTSTNYTLESTAGEIATGESSSGNYALKAGYQQMVTTFISMSAPVSVVMSPALGGLSGGISNGSTSVTVTTDSFAGYELWILAEESPAMTSGANSIADYVPAGDPDFAFITDADDSHFGYSPSGPDVFSRFLDNGSICNTGALETDLACWDGLDTVSETIARSSGANIPNGSTTTVNFRVGIGSSAFQEMGVYVATTTLTALSL